MLCAASGNPDPEITWFKDFLPIDPSASNGRIKQLRSGKESQAFVVALLLLANLILNTVSFHRKLVTKTVNMVVSCRGLHRVSLPTGSQQKMCGAGILLIQTCRQWLKRHWFDKDYMIKRGRGM